jgi:hypothetical protein
MQPFVFIILLITCMYNEDLMMGIKFPKHIIIISNIIDTKGCIALCFYKIHLIVSKYCNITQMKYYRLKLKLYEAKKKLHSS